MVTISTVLQRADRLRARTGRQEATISKWLFGDARTIKRLREGTASVRVDTLQRAYKRLEAYEEAFGSKKAGAA